MRRKWLRRLDPEAVARARESIQNRIEYLKRKVRDFTITLKERRELQKKYGVTYEELVWLAWYKPTEDELKTKEEKQLESDEKLARELGIA